METFSGSAIYKAQLGQLADVIGMTSEETVTPFSENGVLVEIDVPTRWFHFVVPDGESYKGTLGPDIPVVGMIEVNRRYRGHFIERTTRQLATEQVRQRYELLRLENDPYA
jgi:hypothetical protein